ncbi:MAG TPA: cadherin-like domain-containing protein [Solirubrobacterales bacterium]|nr:cadherin-like domain-containing protein [Solirubrobacterales bacterium]
MPAAAAAADFEPAPGTYIVDTSTLKITGPGTDITGVDQGGVAVFAFGTVNIPSGVTLNASGSRPLRIQASGDLTLAGVLNGNGTSTENFDSGPGSPGGPGGGSGGSGNASTWTQGEGIGGGGAATSYDDGGGGGGFGGAGARGGTSSFNAAGVGGAAGRAYGSLDGGFVGGSGGSGSSSAAGGGGGGAIALFGRTVTITSSGEVHADGGGGAVGSGGSGGGSGGGILVVGSVIDNQGQITARGGEGGAGGCCGDGGGGGGGRVSFRGTVLVATGTPDVTGGTSGTRSTPTPFGHGALSPDFKGADGVVTRTTGTRVINFDDTTASSLFVGSEGPLRDRYAGQGVRFTGPAANDGGAILNVNTFGVNGQSGLNALAFNTGVTYTPEQGGGVAQGPETITFDTPISSASINTGQGAGGTATLTAFRGSTVVGSAFRTSSATLAPLTVSGEHITSLVLSFTGSAIVFDDLRWNTEPISKGDSFSVNQGGALSIPASGVLGNDSDPDGDPLTATLESAPANGSVSLQPDGGFTYTPKSGFTGTDSFSYRASDGNGSGNSATVSINVVAPPPPSSSSSSSPPPPASSPPPLLSSTIGAHWLPFRAYTKVLSLSVSDIPAGGQVSVQCKTKTKRQQEKGCPFASKAYKVEKATRKLNLGKPFLDKKVPVGAKIAITITAPGFTGKRFTYVIRRSKPPKPPKPVCILAGGKPGACPS